MGVKELWSILQPVQQHIRLEDLRGQTVAVDLSIWVVEAQGMKQLHAVHKPHLRNLFFRVQKLLQLEILPVFVLEGDPPALKYEAMQRRLHGAACRSGTQPMKMGRSHFKSKLRECAEMLSYLGVPCVQSRGEAEAFCALLNRHGLVDACITEDGDAFLYGATTVYRNFTINIKDPSVEVYELADIEKRLGMTRDTMVALALLLGCDYLPKGVPGVGKEISMKLVSSLPGLNLLDRMKHWRKMSEDDIKKDGSVELSVRRKALVDPTFPNKQVIQEFLVSKDNVPAGSWVWKCPVMFHMQRYAVAQLEWEEEYTQDKMLSLLSLWTQRQVILTGCLPSKGLKPSSIIRTRVHKKIPVYEVEWFKYEGDATTGDEYYKTTEEQQLFNQCFPNLQHDFLLKSTKPKGMPKSKTKVSKESRAINVCDTAINVCDTAINVCDTAVDVCEDLHGNDKENSRTKTKKCVAVKKVAVMELSGDEVSCEPKKTMPVSPNLHEAQRHTDTLADTVKALTLSSPTPTSDSDDDLELLPLSQRLLLRSSQQSEVKECHSIVAKPKAKVTVTGVNRQTDAKKSKSKKLKNKKAGNGDRLAALHEELQLLCMDSFLGDVSTGPMQDTEPTSGSTEVQQTRPDVTQRQTLTETHSLELDDADGDIISGAAEMLNESKASEAEIDKEQSHLLLPNNCPTGQFDIDQCVKSVHITGEITAMVDTLQLLSFHSDSVGEAGDTSQVTNLSAWTHSQIGNFSLGLTFSESCAEVDSKDAKSDMACLQDGGVQQAGCNLTHVTPVECQPRSEHLALPSVPNFSSELLTEAAANMSCITESELEESDVVPPSPLPLSQRLSARLCSQSKTFPTLLPTQLIDADVFLD